MGHFSGKTVLITGAARGQGRAHALRFAQAGANLVLLDICDQIPTAPYPMATPDDLTETVSLAEAEGARVMASVVDVRDLTEVTKAVDESIEHFGRTDVVVANAGIFGTPAKVWEIEAADFRAVIDVDLVGVWNIIRAVVPGMVQRGGGGSIVATVSGAGTKGLPNIAAYVAAKHGVIGLMRTTARELAPHGIRANSVLPGNTNTPMFRNATMTRLFVPEQEDPDESLFLQRAAENVPQGIPFVESEDVAEAVLWLASDLARHVTGITLPVDGGSGIP